MKQEPVSIIYRASSLVKDEQTVFQVSEPSPVKGEGSTAKAKPVSEFQPTRESPIKINLCETFGTANPSFSSSTYNTGMQPLFSAGYHLPS